MNLIKYLVVSFFMTPGILHASGCDLKIAELKLMSEKRMKDVRYWEDEMNRISPQLKKLGGSIQDSFYQSQSCSSSQSSELHAISDSLQELAEDPYRVNVEISKEREKAFTCLSEIGVRLSSAQDKAMAASNRLQVQRLGQISDKLSATGSFYTDALFGAEAARLRNGRLIELTKSLQTLCEGTDF